MSKFLPVYLPIEVLPRELDSRLLVASVMSNYGCRVFIGQSTVLELMARRFPGVYLHKMHGFGDRNLVGRLADSGNLVAAIDEEALHLSNIDNWIRHQTSHLTLSRLSRVFANSKAQFEALTNAYPDHISKIVLTGNPRTDVLSDDFKSLRSLGLNRRRVPQRFVLVITNFAAANFSRGYGVSMLSHQIATSVSDGNSAEDHLQNMGRVQKYLQIDTNALIAYRSAVVHLAERLPHVSFVLRPHPSEELRTWKKWVADYSNITVDRSWTASSWAEKADCIVHPGSTASIEAALLGKPVLYYNPSAHSGMEANTGHTFPDYFGLHMSDLDSLTTSIELFWEGSAPPGSTWKGPSSSSEPNSYLQIAEELGKLAKDGPDSPRLLRASVTFFFLSFLVELKAFARTAVGMISFVIFGKSRDRGINYLKFPWIFRKRLHVRLKEFARLSRTGFVRSWWLIQWGPRSFILSSRGQR